MTFFIQKLSSLTMLGILALSITTINASSADAQDDIGPKVGNKVENFALNTHEGIEQDLNTMLENGPLAIVFYRSSSW